MFANLTQIGEDLQRVVQSPIVAAVAGLLMATGAIWAFYSKYLRHAKLRGLIICTFIFLTLAGLAYAAAQWVFPPGPSRGQGVLAGPSGPSDQPVDPREAAYQQFVEQGRQFREKGFYDDAIKAFEKALEQKKDGTEATLGLTETRANRESYLEQMKIARNEIKEERYASARTALQRALGAKPKDEEAAKLLVEVDEHVKAEAELASWFVLPLTTRPDRAAVVVVRVDGDADADGVARVREQVEQQVVKEGYRVWRLGLKSAFARDRFDTLWDGDVLPTAWKHRLLGSRPPDLFVLVRLTLSAPEKAPMDYQLVRGTLKLRGVTADGRPHPVQTGQDVFALVTARLATDAVIDSLAKQVEANKMVQTTLKP